MLTIGLADIIDATDTCTPGSPNYIPDDPVCAATDQAIPLPASSGEMDFDTGNTASSRTSCPPGYSLISGSCVSQSGGPAIKPASAAGTSPAAASILGSGISWWWLVGLAGLGAGAWYFAKHRKGSAKLSGPRKKRAAESQEMKALREAREQYFRALGYAGNTPEQVREYHKRLDEISAKMKALETSKKLSGPGARDVKLKDRNRGHVWLSVADGMVVGATGSEPKRYIGLTIAQARHLARYGSVAARRHG